jgi:hypothetical protein
MVVPKEAPVPTPFKVLLIKTPFFSFFSKGEPSPSPLPIADPNIPIATPATPAVRPYQNFLLNFKVLHRLAIEVEAACLPNIPAALFLLNAP